MKKNLFYSFLVLFFAIAACQSSGQKSKDGNKNQDGIETGALSNENILSENELSDGWVLLFDGKTSDGWRGANKDHFPAVWKVVDGTIYCEGGVREPGITDDGDILYEKKFKNFHLKMEWKVGAEGNSGIFYLAREVPGWPLYKAAPEMQLLDNTVLPDAPAEHKAGSLYDLVAANPQNTKPAGEWNSVEIICNEGDVVHKQNGETILEYQLWTEKWNKMIADSKFYQETNPDFYKVAKEGFIGLQDHGDDVWFRNIKIKEL